MGEIVFPRLNQRILPSSPLLWRPSLVAHCFSLGEKAFSWRRSDADADAEGARARARTH